jgi:nonsense-mediated mRNA decay protein 3
MFDLICPKCGKHGDEKEFIEAFCTDCYPVKLKCPTKLKLEQCKGCEKLKISGEWTAYSDKKISDFVIGKCRGDFKYGNFDLENHIAEFTVVKDGKQTTVRRSILFEMVTTLCKYCSRISGGYFQGIVQLRGPEKKVEKYANMFIKKLSNKTFITKEEEKHGGFDLYVGNSKAVIVLLSELEVKATITRKLVGLEEGRRLYRTSFLIRL